MPIYEYACPTCGREFEKLLFRSTDAVECPGCGTGEVRRRLSTFSVGGTIASAPCGDFPMSGCGSGGCGGGGCGLN